MPRSLRLARRRLGTLVGSSAIVASVLAGAATFGAPIVAAKNAPPPSTGGFSFPSSFGYWTDPVSASNTPTVPNMITPTGANAPAPWVPFTRSGCDWGGVATANTVLENNGAVFVTGGPTGLRTAAAAGD